MYQPSKRYREFVERLCDYFRSAVFADEYALYVNFQETIEAEGGNPGDVVYAAVNIDPTYLSLRIRFSGELEREFLAGARYKVADAVCHEFCHLLTQPLYLLAIADAAPSEVREIEAVRERQTQRITNAILKLVPREIYQDAKSVRAKTQSRK